MDAEFLKELEAKLKAAGLPMLEDMAEKIYKVVSEHAKGFNYSNAIVKAIVPAAVLALDAVVLPQLEKIDPQS